MLGEKIKDFWSKYGDKTVLLVGFILVAAVAFESGYLEGKKQKDPTLIIEKSSETSGIVPKQEKDAIMDSGSQAPQKPSEKKQNQAGTESGQNWQNCAFVGSKNSDKFYPPGCSYAKRIKPGNVVCFSSREEAIQKGRTESTGCNQ